MLVHAAIICHGLRIQSLLADLQAFTPDTSLHSPQASQGRFPLLSGWMTKFHGSLNVLRDGLPSCLISRHVSFLALQSLCVYLSPFCNVVKRNFFFFLKWPSFSFPIILVNVSSLEFSLNNISLRKLSLIFQTCQISQAYSDIFPAFLTLS